MAQNDLFAAGTGTGSTRTSRPRAAAFARSGTLAFSIDLAVVRQGSAKATWSAARGHRIALRLRNASLQFRARGAT